MNFAAALFHRFRWLNVPGALLLVLLQRTPVLRLFVAAEEMVTRSPLAAVVRSAAVAFASLGAMHSLAGATTLRVQQNSVVYVQFGDPPRLSTPLTGSVGSPITPILVFVNGAPTQPGSYQITGLPPGISVAGANANGIVNASSVVISGTPTSAGSFTASIAAWEFPGGPTAQPVTSRFPETGPIPVTFTVSGSANIAPTIDTQPVGQIVAPGGSATLSVSASGAPEPAYQWQHNDVPIAGATAATLALGNVTAADAGDYRVVVSNAAGSVTSRSVSLSVIASGSNARLSNLSVRTSMVSGQTLIVGMVVQGGSRDILVRAAGPALGNFDLTGVMSDPRLALFNGSTAEFSNDDWPATLAGSFSSVGAFPFTTGSKDAAFLRGIDGPRSIQASGAGAGVVLVEAYDTGAPNAAHLVNVSARNRVGTGDDILIAGFTISGSGEKPLLIRAVGPKLAAFGVDGYLIDPKLEIYQDTTKRGENDNWDPSIASTFTAVGAFGLDAGSRDAALLTSLPPGSYTVQVRGVDNSTGEALVEIYELP